MLKAIIIEDELDAQVLLQKIIEEYCPDVELLGTANNLQSGKELIESTQPDIIFLDIQLGCETGFQLLEMVDHKTFKLIITTAFQDFALKAFKYEAIDYVLKPYSPKSILAALNKVKKQTIDNSEVYKKLEALLISQTSPTKISLPTSEGYIMVCPDDIVHVAADRSYSQVYLASKKKLLISKPLKEIEAVLPAHSFFRLHSSHLINMNRLEMYNKEDGGYALMTNGTQVPIARRRKSEFINRLTNNGQSSINSNL